MAARDLLNEPLSLQLFGPDRVEPALLDVDHVDVPLLPVTLEFRAAADSVEVRVRQSGKPAVSFAVAVNRIPLEIQPGSLTVDGFGLGTVALTVPFPATFTGDSIRVTITGEAVTPEPSQIVLTRGSPTTVIVRSKGSRLERFTVRGPHFTTPGHVDIRFAPPIGFALAGLSGGALGAISRELFVRRRKRSSARPRHSFAKSALAGLIAGLFLAVAYALGVKMDWINLSGPPVEALVFLVTGLGAIGGMELLFLVFPALAHALEAK